jgi:glycosyltransferase involved in cell wall biosynthesis
MKVLVLMANYLPGFKAGGPVRSVANLVEALGDEINFSVVARDRDRGSRERYATIVDERWQAIGKAQVAYVTIGRWPTLRLQRLADDVRPDVLYINSFCNPRCCAGALALVRAGRIRPRGIVIAPHGEFSRGALAIRRWKKAPYFAAMKAARLARNVLWHATSEPERDDILRVMGPAARVFVASNLCDPSPFSPPARPEKVAGRLRLAYLARIVPNKNLLGALTSLDGVSGRVELDVWGPVEDHEYWRQCQQRITRLPANVTVNCRGVASPDAVRPLLGAYDALLFPTHTENFGYVIVEALVAGCPIVVSDRTPWRGLAKLGVGWDLPLDDHSAFRGKLNQLAAMDETAHAALRQTAAEYGRRQANGPAAIHRCRTLFETALQSDSRAACTPAAARRAA